jgi:hypothetical protein
MSHRVGTIQTVSPSLVIGPDSGKSPTSSKTWLVNFSHTPAPGGTKFLMLHFTAANFPAKNRLEVDLGYDTDVFRAADGTDFWTRPVNVTSGQTVTIRYITDGSPKGHATLSEYGRGEVVESGSAANPDGHNQTNPDYFLHDSSYAEPPFYEQRGLCNPPNPDWENVECAPGGDIRQTVAQSVCVFVMAEMSEYVAGTIDLSSCTGTLVGPDLVLCAGHCVSDPGGLNIASGSVSFDYQTNCDGTRPAGYNAKFYKVERLVKSGFTAVGGLDYALMQIAAPPGLAPITMRPDLPSVGDQVFEVHHPTALVKKVSAQHSGPQATISNITSTSPRYIYTDTDLSGGSSGSALFDTSGRILGIADISGHCANGFLSVTEVLTDIAATPPLPVKRDVMMVFDRSGSMSMDAGTGRTKVVEARDAASLFVQLIRAGAGDRIGLVSFSTSPSSPADFKLAAVNATNKTKLIGTAPYSSGIVGGLIPDGLTTIGGGLKAALGEFPPMASGVNQRTILLMTDGLQNTPPMIADEDAPLTGTDLSVIGFGQESSLNGPLLDQLAQTHNGLYTRAGTGLQLKKFFALAFGNIFENGVLTDPEFFLPAAQRQAQPLKFTVCEEETITAVMGWDPHDATLLLELTTPAGKTISLGSPGIVSATGLTWMFMRVNLPYGGERDGTWQVQVFRPGGGEFPPPGIDVRYFINVVVKGGPRLTRVNPFRKYYTGDDINPLIWFKHSDGSTPDNASMRLTVTRPGQSVGNVLSQAKLGPAVTMAGDVIPARQATLQAIERTTGKPAITYVDDHYQLFDDGIHDDGAMDPDGLFGNPLKDILTTEGNYTFHAVATSGVKCIATRELLWTLHVDTGIDPGKTGITTTVVGDLPGGGQQVHIVITPRDKYGNLLGPGRGADLSIGPIPGTTIIGGPQDLGDGSYGIDVNWNPSSGYQPGVTVTQPGRPPVVVVEPCKQPSPVPCKPREPECKEPCQTVLIRGEMIVPVGTEVDITLGGSGNIKIKVTKT